MRRLVTGTGLTCSTSYYPDRQLMKQSNLASPPFCDQTSRKKSGCVIEREIGGFLHKFLEESRGSRTCQNGRQSRQIDRQDLIESPL
ncbi:hypothetical protein TNCV_187441 [Trichonephila clavipes]|nr:hypothetical protein TNCV_187441 [Trichonephila clavipes]